MKGGIGSKKKIDWKLRQRMVSTIRKPAISNGFFKQKIYQRDLSQTGSLRECLMFLNICICIQGSRSLKIAQDTEQRFQIETGSGLRVFQYLVLCRRIPICMSGNINLSEYRAVMTEKEARQYG